MELYRGKSVGTGDWIIGAAVCIGDKAHILGSESLFPERPAYHGMAIGAGLEDSCITDRYEAAAYGWTKALDRYEENFPVWIEVIPETVTRCFGMPDMSNNVLFEGDIIKNSKGRIFEICYGKYFAHCDVNVGFFLVAQGYEPIPIGETEKYAYLVGNIFDNPELRQDAGQSAGQWADQPTLRPAT